MTNTQHHWDFQKLNHPVSKPKKFESLLYKLSIWMSPKIVVPPNHPFVNRVFHYKPSILGVKSPIFGNTHIYIFYYFICDNSFTSWTTFCEIEHLLSSLGVQWIALQNHLHGLKTLGFFSFKEKPSHHIQLWSNYP